MRFDGLPVFVLQQIRERSLERTWRATREGRGVTPGLDAVAPSLVADEPDPRIVDERVEDADRVGPAPWPTEPAPRIVEERVEDADRVGPAANARCHRVGQPTGLLDDLHPCFQPDNALKVTHHRRERMRACGGAEAVT